jgi:hypothetical protein
VSVFKKVQIKENAAERVFLDLRHPSDIFTFFLNIAEKQNTPLKD